MQPYWLVYKNGKDTGLVEFDYVYASGFWGEIAKLSGNIYQLMPRQVQNHDHLS